METFGFHPSPTSRMDKEWTKFFILWHLTINSVQSFLKSLFFFLFKLFHRNRQHTFLVESCFCLARRLRQAISHKKAWSMWDTDPLLRVEVIHQYRQMKRTLRENSKGPRDKVPEGTVRRFKQLKA